jgi:hypothetical protein
MRQFILWSLLAAFSTAMLGAQADTSTPPVSNAAVARVSVISGTVSTQRADTGEWDAAALNTPLTSGDKISTGDDGRTEVQLDYANVLRLSHGSQANLVSMTNSQFQIQLATGLADYVVLKGAQATAEIDTPNVAVHPNGPGVFRIQVNSDSETQVIVREGEADISTPQGSTRLKKGEEITIQGTDAPEYKIADAPGQDDWDHWNKDRDSNLTEAQAYTHTNRYYTGAGDLDNYGYWTDVPGYGEVWVPNENSSWTPYSDGRWDWEPYWGWTWVGYEPWGWAPYHYGRWFPYRDRWVWWPGPVTPYYRPVWAPAYVSFFGWHGGFGVGVSVGFGGGWGSIGWLPIGPCDEFRPWWGGRDFDRGDRGDRRIGFDNGRVFSPLAPVGRGRVVYSNLANLHTDERLQRGLIRVPSSEFGRGVLSARQHVTPVDLRQGQALRGTLPVAPTRGFISATHERANPVAVPQRAATRFFGSTGRASSQAGFNAGRAGAEGPTRQGGMTRFTPAGGVNGSESVRGGASSRGIESRGQSPAQPQPHSIENQPRAGWHGFNGGADAAGGGAIRGGNTVLRGAGGVREAAPAPLGTRSASPEQSNPNQPRAGWHGFNGGAEAAGGGAIRGGNPALRGAGGVREAAPAPLGTRNASPEQSNPNQPRAGWERFNSGAGADGGGAMRGGDPALRAGGSIRGTAPAPVERGTAPGWGRFTPQPNSGQQESMPSSPGSRRGGYSEPQGSFSEPRGSGGAVARPPLEVGHAIVRQAAPAARESAPANRGDGGGGYRSSGGGGRPSGGGGSRPSGGNRGGGDRGHSLAGMPLQ